MNVSTEEQCRELFSEEDKNKILKVDKWGNSNKVVQFKTIEDRDAALDRLPDDVKTRTQEDRSKPLVKVFQHRENKTYASRGGAGNWGASGRGGATNTSGYRSAGGGRGRGGDRGGRGGRGRGGLKGDTSSPAAAPSTPAAD